MFIGIDIGGTNIRAGLVGYTGSVHKIDSAPCPSGASESDVMEALCRMTDALLTPEVEGIGIGVPSVVDAEKGIVYNVANIPSWKEVHLKEYLENRYGIPVAVNNDCNCFALGAARYGEARGAENAACVTLGTGVGCGLILGGTLYSGHNTGAGEIGSIPYLDRDYEYYCSSRFFLDRGTTGRKAAEAASPDTPDLLRLWDEFGRHVGELVKLILYAYDPEVIVFGGSIAKASGLFEETMRQTVRTFPYPKSVERLRIVPTALEEAGLLGAASLCIL